MRPAGTPPCRVCRVRSARGRALSEHLRLFVRHGTRIGPPHARATPQERLDCTLCSVQYRAHRELEPKGATMMEQLKAFEIAVELYCCLLGHSGGKPGNAEFWAGLGVDWNADMSLLDLLAELAKRIHEKAYEIG